MCSAYDSSFSKNPEFPCDKYGAQLELDDMEDSECKAEFRVKIRDILALADVLQIPDAFKCYQGSICEGIEGRFCRPVPLLSIITNKVLDFIYKIHSHRILQWNHGLLQPWSKHHATVMKIKRENAPC